MKLAQKVHAVFERIDTYQTVETSELELLADAAAVLLEESGEQPDDVWGAIYELLDCGLPLHLDPPPCDRYETAKVCAVLAWRERDHAGAAEAFRAAVSFAPDSAARGAVQRELARVLFESGDDQEALELLSEIDVDDVPYDLQMLVEVTTRSVNRNQIPTTHEFIASVINDPRIKYRARRRVSVLYDTIECARHAGAIESVEALATEAHSLAKQTGIPFTIYSTGLALGNALRTLGEIPRALEVLDGLPTIRFGEFDSTARIKTEKALALMHQGRFEEADRSLSGALQNADRLGDAASFKNLLAIRAAMWLAQGRSDRALEASRQAVENPAVLNYVVNAFCEMAIGDADVATERAAEVFELWSDVPNSAGKTIAWGIRAVLHRDEEALKTSIEASLSADAPFVSFAHACDLFLKGEQIAEGDALFGSVAGVALFGYAQHVQASPSIQEIENGLFVVGGTTVDLRRRHAMRRILEAFRESPGEVFDAVDLFNIGWDEDPLPTTFSDRVYFAIYELRRLGFRRFIQNDENGYVWSSE